MSAIKVDEYYIQLANMSTAFPQLLKNGYSKTMLLTDENTRQFCLKTYNEISRVKPDSIFEIKAGELQKSLETCMKIWNGMLEVGMDRRSLLIILGGGVLCDMGGFCASTYMRGIDFVSIPTTLLAQVDASLGGKLGVDYLGYKNLLGMFKNPKEVYIEYKFLESLPKRELESGYVEVLKHLILASSVSWDKAKRRPMPDLQELPFFIKKSLSIKKQVIQSDPYDKGIRNILNFGHTIGHALESLYLKEKHDTLHGECIAAGIICESYLSQRVFEFEEEILDDITQTFLPFANNIKFEKSDIDQIFKHMQFDKKAESGVLYFSLIRDIGNAKYHIKVPKALIRESLSYYSDQLHGDSINS